MSRRSDDSEIIVSKEVINLKPASVDPERLFSFGRVSRSYLQTQMKPEIHNRNVFLKKNTHIS